MNDLNQLAKIINQDNKDKIVTLFNNIRSRTPIDTGAARASYNLTNQPFNASKVAQESFEQPIKEYQGDDITLYSQCPYLGALESGYSKQAPLGFIAISISDFLTN